MKSHKFSCGIILCLISAQGLALGVEVSRFTELINIRIYFMHRLKPAITILETIEKNNKQYIWLWDNQGQDVLTNINDFFGFTDYRICNAIVLMKKRQSFLPLLHVWNDFIHYKYLYDEKFLEDFSKLLLAIVKNILMGLVPHKYNFYRYEIMNTCHIALKQPVYCIVPYLDKAVEKILEIFKMNHHYDEKTLRSFESEKFIAYPEFDFIQITSYTDALHKRHYFIKRLEPIMKVITKKSNLTEPWFETFDIKSAMYRFAYKLVINHPDVQACKEQIEYEQSMSPLLTLWEDISSFKHIGDDQYIHDFSLLVFVALKNNIIQQASQSNGNITTLMYDLQVFHEQINSLTSEKLLEVLDILHEKIEVLGFSPHYQSQSYDWVSNIKNIVYITSACVSLISCLLYGIDGGAS